MLFGNSVHFGYYTYDVERSKNMLESTKEERKLKDLSKIYILYNQNVAITLKYCIILR